MNGSPVTGHLMQPGLGHTLAAMTARALSRTLSCRPSSTAQPPEGQGSSLRHGTPPIVTELSRATDVSPCSPTTNPPTLCTLTWHACMHGCGCEVASLGVRGWLELLRADISRKWHTLNASARKPRNRPESSIVPDPMTRERGRPARL